MASASFCIVGHLICVGVNDLLIKAIGCQMAPTTWNKTPPIPKSDASVYKRMSNLLSSMKYIRVFLIRPKTGKRQIKKTNLSRNHRNLVSLGRIFAESVLPRDNISSFRNPL